MVRGMQSRKVAQDCQPTPESTGQSGVRSELMPHEIAVRLSADIANSPGSAPAIPKLHVQPDSATS